MTHSGFLLELDGRDCIWLDWWSDAICPLMTTGSKTGSYANVRIKTPYVPHAERKRHGPRNGLMNLSKLTKLLSKRQLPAGNDLIGGAFAKE